MRAAALLGPAGSPRDLKRFSGGGAELVVVERLDAEAWDAVLVFGGDGTLHRHLAELRRTQVPALVVPVGSGNDFARCLRVKTVRRAWRAWRKFCAGAGNVRTVDLGLIRAVGGSSAAQPETYFCCIGSVGLDSDANRRANAMRPWLRAHGGYVLGVLREIATYQFPVMRIDLGDHVHPWAATGAPQAPVHPPFLAEVANRLGFNEPATLVVFANAASYGDGMRMAPRARLDDGLLDVCFVRRTSRMRLLRFFPRVFTGQHLDLPEVEYLQARSLRVETDRPMDVYADGEYVCQTPVQVTIEPRALRVIV